MDTTPYSIYPGKAHASQDIVCSSTILIPQINLKLRKLNLPSCLFQKDTPYILS